MALPLNDPNECLDTVIAYIPQFMQTGEVPNLPEAAGHGSTVLGALLHNHGVGAAGVDVEQLKRLGDALGVEAPAADEGVGGPFVNLFLQALITKLGPIVAAWIQKWIEQMT